LDYDFLRRMVGQWRGYAGNYLGDYYPLTPYTTANDAWIGWQFHRPESDSGMVQVFRRADSVYEAARLKLRGLLPEEHYQLTDIDRPERVVEAAGRELVEEGVRVEASRAPAAVIMTYRRR
jgi:alpha-galactosidase